MVGKRRRLGMFGHTNSRHAFLYLQSQGDGAIG